MPDELYCALGLYQGKVDRENLRLNKRTDIAVQAVVDLLEDNIPADVKEAFRNSDQIYPIMDFYTANAKALRKYWIDEIEKIYGIMNRDLLKKMSAYKWSGTSIGSDYTAPGMEIELSYVYDKNEEAWYFSVKSDTFDYYFKSA